MLRTIRPALLGHSLKFARLWLLTNPLGRVWVFLPRLVMLMANSAELITWGTSWGRLREGTHGTRSIHHYFIKKHEVGLGVSSLFEQPWTGQKDTVKDVVL
jgi:sterol-4alpha-carboxylate 3-dehydrogenase (decarboxylating)